MRQTLLLDGFRWLTLGLRFPASCLTLYCLATCQTQAATDPNLTVSLRLTNQNVVLGWFASNGVPYRLESSANLVDWTNASGAITGAGSALFVTNSIADQTNGFFRVKRLPLITAVFDGAMGILTITGDEADNSIIVQRDVSGRILVNEGDVPISGGIPTVANTTLLQIFGRAGHDHLALDEANGILPRANLSGEAGDDTLIGGAGADVLLGGSGMNYLLGRGGNDTLVGGNDDDILEGGDGDDIVQMGEGNDLCRWNPGDDTDIVEGGNGTDTMEVNGGNGSEDFTVIANGTRVRFDRINPAPFSLDIGGCEFLVLNANGGNDTFSTAGNLAALIQVTVDGGAGQDTISGSNGNDVLLGGEDNDLLDGNQGNDVIFLGAGDDTFRWDPGDGSDVIEGQDGHDTLSFNGSGANETFELGANGSRLRFTRNVGNVTLDGRGMENIQINAGGGTDVVLINDLTGTDVVQIALDLAGLPGSGTGDAQVDNIIINGTQLDDVILVSGTSGTASVVGLAATVNLLSAETANDRLTINMLGGDDIADATGLAASSIALIVDGGANNDVITGGEGDDVLLGGDGDDVLIGGPGVDVLDGGLGNNIVIQ